jgi:hypothetical protein
VLAACLTAPDGVGAILEHLQPHSECDRQIRVLPSGPPLMRLCLILGSGSHELMSFSSWAPLESARGRHGAAGLE